MIKRTPWQIQRAVVFALLMREIKTRFGGHWTGVIWLVGSPLIQVFVLVLVNTYLRGRLSRGSYEFAIFLIVAMMPYQLCTGLWSQLMTAVKSNLGLFNYRQVKPMDTIVARALLELVIDAIVFVIAMIILARAGFQPILPEQLLAYLGVWGLFFLLGSTIGLTLATVIGPLPRLGFAVQLLSLPLMFSSGVLFSVHGLPQDVLDWLLYNPLLHLVELSRVAYLPGYNPLNGVNVYFPLMVTLLFGALGISLYRLRRQKMASGD
ncbi:ABC transporter permease [Ideonella sp.]|uniref:ABC transporter permease n=1 Tax=Ideonella sp. TaxID=1929293 RepID=UPI003BB772F8